MWRILGAVLVLLTTTTSCFAALWLENRGDAGKELSTAQRVFAGTEPLVSILGNLDDNFDVDLYVIYIPNPLLFSAATVDAPGFNVPDPQLFLFNAMGLATYMNDDDESGLNGSQSLLPSGHLFGPIAPGRYSLGIGWFDNEPFSTTGQMFAAGGQGTQGPGAGGTSALLGWDDNVSGRIDRETFYEIQLTGAAPVPEPGTVGLLVLSGIAFALSHRRRLCGNFKA